MESKVGGGGGNLDPKVPVGGGGVMKEYREKGVELGGEGSRKKPKYNRQSK
jgi:hypothetical protein